MRDKKEYGKWEVKVSVSEMIDRNHEEFLDLLSELSVGHTCLMDITYKATSVCEDGSIKMSVVGDNEYGETEGTKE